MWKQKEEEIYSSTTHLQIHLFVCSSENSGYYKSPPDFHLAQNSYLLLSSFSSETKDFPQYQMRLCSKYYRDSCENKHKGGSLQALSPLRLLLGAL